MTSTTQVRNHHSHVSNSRIPPTAAFPPPSWTATPTMMRVAIAGTGGLAYMIAHHIVHQTGHYVILLSRSPKPNLEQRGLQVLPVEYESHSSLDYALTGVDVVISTIPSSTAQISLINSAIRKGVRRFAPAEFEGRPVQRTGDLLDRGKTAVLAHLHTYRNQIESTVFACGVLYERFAPYGLYNSNIGLSSGIQGEGDYLIDVRNRAAEIPLYDLHNQLVTICMTAAQDVGKFVVHALQLPQWPPELTMYGERMTLRQLLQVVSEVRGGFEDHNIIYHNRDSLLQELSSARSIGDRGRLTRVTYLLATLDGRYNYDRHDLNTAFPRVKPLKFRDWLAQVWHGQ